MRLPAIAALCLLFAAPALAQPSLRACTDEGRPAAARLGACNEALRLALPQPARAQALAARANVRTMIVLGGIEATRREAPDSPPPRAAFDPALEDLLEALRLGANGEAVMQLALLRLWRGELGAAALRHAMLGDDEAIVRDMTAAIDGGGAGWAHFAVRGGHRMMAGLPGAEEDFAEVRQRLYGQR
jgi:hypothetical protein